MKLNKKMKGLNSFVLILFSCVTIDMAQASTLRIINENMDDIMVTIVPEPASGCPAYCWECIAGVTTELCKQELDFTVPSEKLRGSSYFAVIGTTGGFLFNGECRNLNAFRNYEIRFLNKFVGTSCVSREI